MYKCQYCGKECKNPNSLRNHERCCPNNPNRNYKNGMLGKIAWNKGLTKETDERVKKQSEVTHKKYLTGELTPHRSPMLNEETRKKHKLKMQEVYKNRIPHSHTRSKHGYYKDIWFESSWELMFIVYCLENNINFMRNNKGFNYLYKNENKTYFPDFYLIDSNEYVEVKGVKTEKDEIKWKQFPEKLIIMSEKTDIYNKIKNYITKKYGKNYYKNIMAVLSGTGLVS